MAVMLSSYLWLRNNNLVPLLEDPYSEPKLSVEDKENLKFIIDEVDQLHQYGQKVSQEPVIGPDPKLPNAVLAGYLQITEETPLPEKTAQLFEGVHNILKKYFVRAEYYWRLGKAFDELELQPSVEAAEAIDYATGLCTRRRLPGKRHGTLERICWDVIKDKETREERYSA